MKKQNLDWKQVATIAVLIDTKVCQDIMNNLKSGPLCINDIAGLTKYPRHVVKYNVTELYNAGLISRSGDPALNASWDAREVFMLTKLGKEYV